MHQHSAGNTSTSSGSSAVDPTAHSQQFQACGYVDSSNNNNNNLLSYHVQQPGQQQQQSQHFGLINTNNNNNHSNSSSPAGAAGSVGLAPVDSTGYANNYLNYHRLSYLSSYAPNFDGPGTEQGHSPGKHSHEADNANNAANVSPSSGLKEVLPLGNSAKTSTNMSNKKIYKPGGVVPNDDNALGSTVVVAVEGDEGEISTAIAVGRGFGHENTGTVVASIEPDEETADFEEGKNGSVGQQQPLAVRTVYLSANCVLNTYIENSLQDAVAEHFERSLNLFYKLRSNTTAATANSGGGKEFGPPDSYYKNYYSYYRYLETDAKQSSGLDILSTLDKATEGAAGEDNKSAASTGSGRNSTASTVNSGGSPQHHHGQVKLGDKLSEHCGQQKRYQLMRKKRLIKRLRLMHTPMVKRKLPASFFKASAGYAATGSGCSSNSSSANFSAAAAAAAAACYYYPNLYGQTTTTSTHASGGGGGNGNNISTNGTGSGNSAHCNASMTNTIGGNANVNGNGCYGNYSNYTNDVYNGRHYRYGNQQEQLPTSQQQQPQQTQQGTYLGQPTQQGTELGEVPTASTSLLLSAAGAIEQHSDTSQQSVSSYAHGQANYYNQHLPTPPQQQQQHSQHHQQQQQHHQQQHHNSGYDEQHLQQPNQPLQQHGQQQSTASKSSKSNYASTHHRSSLAATTATSPSANCSGLPMSGSTSSAAAAAAAALATLNQDLSLEISIPSTLSAFPSVVANRPTLDHHSTMSASVNHTGNNGNITTNNGNSMYPSNSNYLNLIHSGHATDAYYYPYGKQSSGTVPAAAPTTTAATGLVTTASTLSSPLQTGCASILEYNSTNNTNTNVGGQNYSWTAAAGCSASPNVSQSAMSGTGTGHPSNPSDWAAARAYSYSNTFSQMVAQMQQHNHSARAAVAVAAAANVGYHHHHHYSPFLSSLPPTTAAAATVASVDESTTPSHHHHNLETGGYTGMDCGSGQSFLANTAVAAVAGLRGNYTYDTIGTTSAASMSSPGTTTTLASTAAAAAVAAAASFGKPQLLRSVHELGR